LTRFAHLFLELLSPYPRMSDSFVTYRKAVEWFEEGKTVRALLFQEEATLNEKETVWRKERTDAHRKIADFKRRIHENYGEKDCIRRNNKIISSYKSHIASEEEMMKKMEYAIKCLEFIKSEMIKDANRVTTDGLCGAIGLKECEVGDDLSKTTVKLARFLEGFCSEDEILSYTLIEEGGEVPVYAPAEALYDGGPGKFIQLERKKIAVCVVVDGTLDDSRDGEQDETQDGDQDETPDGDQYNVFPVERNFPTIFVLKREGFSPDDVIGLAHLQFIGEIRDEGEIYFEWVPESNDWKGRYVEGYEGVSFPPDYFLKNEHQTNDQMNWRNRIPNEKPAKMYIGHYSHYEQISSMEDILEDGRLYDNRFGLKYDSKPFQVYWEFDTSVDDY